MNYMCTTRNVPLRIQIADLIKVQHVVQLELIHEQLPLPMPCYDLVFVIEFTVGPTEVGTSGTPDSPDLTGDYVLESRIDVPT